MVVSNINHPPTFMAVAGILFWLASDCTAFVLPTITIEPHRSFSSRVRPIAFLDSSEYGLFSSSEILSVDFSAEVPDGIRIVTLVAVGIMILIAALSAFVTQSVLPSQLSNLGALVETENPDLYAKIQSKLEPNQTFRDRPDLMRELVEAGIQAMQQESDQDAQRILDMVKDKQAQGDGILSIQELVEAKIEMSIEEFVAKVDDNPDSQYLTETTKELAEALRKEIRRE